MQLKRNKRMEFETLKKSHKKQIIVGALAICVIGGALTYATSKAFYKVDGSIDLAKGIINYKPYDFKIMAMYKSDDNINYIEINNMPSSGYVINESKSYCTLDNKNKDTSAKLYTENGKHMFEGLNRVDKCYIYFNKYVPTGSDTIISNLGINTPTFSNTATANEGIYRTNDGMYGGTSYYWRGAVTNNYVKFAGFCWRIVRINGDKSIRLIYDGTICHSNKFSTTDSIAISNVVYNTNVNQSNYVGWTYSGTSQRPTSTTSSTSSNAKTQLEGWFNSNITGTNATKVAQGKYCNDRNAQSGNTWTINGSNFHYAGYKRIYTDYAPTLSCSSRDTYTLNVGLITADEVEFAGGKNETNTSYYLYNGQSYWTMTPAYWYSNVQVFFLDVSGLLSIADVNSTYGLRPVINLRSDIIFSSGDGTLNNPYVVE